MSGVARWLPAGRSEAVVKSLNGKIMLIVTYSVATVVDVLFVRWSGMWLHPETIAHRISRSAAEAIHGGAGAIVICDERVKRFVTEIRAMLAEKVLVAGQAVELTGSRRLRAAAPPPRRFSALAKCKERKGIAG